MAARVGLGGGIRRGSGGRLGRWGVVACWAEAQWGGGVAFSFFLALFSVFFSLSIFFSILFF